MKWLSITKDKSEILNLKRTKDLLSIENDDIIRFIHKKNPHKGKISSLNLSKPYTFKDKTIWCIYYDEPLNKNFKDSDWKFKWKNEELRTFNGIVVIKTVKSKNISLKDVIDLSYEEISEVEKFISFRKEENVDYGNVDRYINNKGNNQANNQANDQANKQENKQAKDQENNTKNDDEYNDNDEIDDNDDDDEDVDDNKNIEDEDEILVDEDADDDDDENENNVVYNYSGCDDEDSDKEESFESKPKANKTSKVSKATVKRTVATHVDTLEVEQNHVLDFEKYSYESDYIS